MSTASRTAVEARTSRAARRRGSRGYTFLEVTITLGLLSLLALVVERTLSSTQEADKYLSIFRYVQERGERASYDVYAAVVSARKVYGRDEQGEGYLEALDLSRLPLAKDARLPRPDEVRPMGPDQPNDPRTGNVILCVRETDPVVCAADPESQKVRYVDIYHFVCVYPHDSDKRVITEDERKARDLVLWYSVGYPSLTQLNAIEDPAERSSVVRDLYHRFDMRYAWDPNADVDESFYPLDEVGQIAGIPEQLSEIPEHQGLSESGMLVYAGIQLARTTPTSFSRKSVFTVDDPQKWVPDGFEVKITGGSGHRKVWFHVVAEAQSARGREATHVTTLIASVRDL